MLSTGPKGTVSMADVHAALATKQEHDTVALQPVTIDLPSMTTHKFDESQMPRQATTNKKELTDYYEKVCSPSSSTQQLFHTDRCRHVDVYNASDGDSC